MYYQNINKKIVINPYPLPIIGEKMQKLEGFQYVTALDLHMGYYTIDMLPESWDLKTIITEFGTFRYNRYPMGMCPSSDIIQAKSDEILGDI